MKKTILTSLLLLILFTGKTQFAVECGLGAQWADMVSYKKKDLYLSVNPAVMLQGRYFFLRAGFRQSIPRTFKYKDNSGRTEKFAETGFVIGFGWTFASTTSRTRPYVMFHYARCNATVNARDTDYAQIRYGGGFQFQVKKGLTVFNEAGLNLTGAVYDINYSIDIGVRYFL